MKIESTKLQNGDLQVTLLFSEHDQLCLNHDLLDIADWYAKGPSFDKIKNCESRMISEYKEKLMQSPKLLNMTMSEAMTLLSDPVLCCKEISSLESYKNRKQRDESLSS